MIKEIIGYILISIPFIAMGWLCFKAGGWRCFLFTFGIAGLIVIMVSLGVYLITGEF